MPFGVGWDADLFAITEIPNRPPDTGASGLQTDAGDDVGVVAVGMEHDVEEEDEGESVCGVRFRRHERKNTA